MTTLPIIVLGALTGLSEGQTVRTQRQLAEYPLKLDEWHVGFLETEYSTAKHHVEFKEDCLRECPSPFLGIKYDATKKKCYCIKTFRHGSLDVNEAKILTGYEYQDHQGFLYGNCGRLSAIWCGIKPNCSWDEEKGFCSPDESGPEYDAEEWLDPTIKKKLGETLKIVELPRCSVKLDKGELPEDTQCRDINLEQCQKKDWDANKECPTGDVWEQGVCAFSESVTHEIATKVECKEKCSEGTYLAINFSSGKSTCDCITKGALFLYSDRDDDTAECFENPEAEEDNASDTAEHCTGINLLSECESSEDIKEECAKECATIRSNFTSNKLEEEKDMHICGQVMACTPYQWGVCAHRCGDIYLAKKEGRSPRISPNSTQHLKKLNAENKRQETLFAKVKSNRNDEAEMQSLIDAEFDFFKTLVTENGDGINIKASFKSNLDNLTLEKANRAMAAENPTSERENAKDNAFLRALTSEDVGQVKLAASHLLRTSSSARNRRALRIINDESTDTVLDVIDNVTFASDLFAEAGSDAFGNLSTTVSLIYPFMGLLNKDNSPEGKLRSLLELKFNLLQQLTANMGPVGTLFTVGHEIIKGVNDSPACTRNERTRVNCSDKLKQEILPIVVTAVVETIGNGHLGDVWNIFQMAEKVRTEGSLKALEVADIMSLGIAGFRGGCALVTFAFPVAAIPCQVTVKFMETVRDMGFFQSKASQDRLNEILGVIENNKIVKAALPVIGKFVTNVGRGIKRGLDAGFNTVVNILGAAASGVVSFFFPFFPKRRTAAVYVSPRNRAPSRAPSRAPPRKQGGGLRRVVEMGVGALHKIGGGVKDIFGGIGKALFGR